MEGVSRCSWMGQLVRAEGVLVWGFWLAAGVFHCRFIMPGQVAGFGEWALVCFWVARCASTAAWSKSSAGRCSMVMASWGQWPRQAPRPSQ